MAEMPMKKDAPAPMAEMDVEVEAGPKVIG